MTYGTMFVDVNGLAWVAASDGIYKTDGLSLSKISDNRENWSLSGIATMTVNGTPTLFYSTTGNINNLFSYPIVNLSGSDVADGHLLTTSAMGIQCLTTDGSKLYYMDSMNTLYSYVTVSESENNRGELILTSSPTSMCYMNSMIYVNTTDNIYSIDPTSLEVTLKATSSPGPVAVDSDDNIFGASTGLFEHNVSFAIDGEYSLWTQIGTAEIETVGISSTNIGYGIDVSGNVYTINTSAFQLASIELTGAAIPPPIIQNPSLIISKTAWASVTNVVLAIDTTINRSYIFEDISSAYHIDVSSGVLSFTDPIGTTVLQPGSTITLRDSSTIYTFTVVDLNLTLTMQLPKPSLVISSSAWASVTNVVLAIDTTIDKFYTFEGISSAYNIDVSGGVLSFIDPTGTSVLQVGSQITLRDGATRHTFTVADLNLTLTNLISSRFDPNATNPTSTLFKGTSNAFASDISAAILAGISGEAILLAAVLQAHDGINTGIYSILPDFYSGTTVSIGSSDISGFYTLLEQDGSTISPAQKAKGLDICVPDKATHTIAITTSSTNNVMLPIDLNSQLTYPLSLSPGNFSGYSITVDASNNQLFQKNGTTISTINYGDVTGTLTFTEGSETFTIEVLHYDLVGSFDPFVPIVRHKAVLDNNLLWVMSPTKLSVLDSYTLRTVTTFSNIMVVSFALDVTNSVLYLATSTGLFTSPYPTGNQFTINVADMTPVTLNGDPFTYAIVDMAISTDTLYFTGSSGLVSSLPLSAINSTGSLTSVNITDAEGNQLIPLALTFANDSVYLSANNIDPSTGTLIKLDTGLNFIERNNFPPNATQIMLNRASIVYAATGSQLLANDYIHLNYSSPVTSNTEAVALASNVNVSVNDTSLSQINYVVTANGNIYKIEPVLQDVTNIELRQMYLSVTVNSGSTVTGLLTLLGSNSASAVLAAALSGGVSNATILLAFAEYAATNSTSIFSAYAGTDLSGASATISAANAASLYTKLGITGPAATKNIFISVPNNGALTLGPSTINTSLAIDDTVTATYSFAGFPDHTLSIASGVQTFTSPSGSTVLSQGSSITLTNESGTFIYPILSLDLTLGARISPDPICFLGDAPVKTPHGYRRMDSLKLGDRVSTPTGSAVIEYIHCMTHAAGPTVNPYVIPKGKFGATQDLYISPRHKVSVGGKMVEARDLGLEQKDIGTVIYYNLGLRDANMIVAGVTVESLLLKVRVTVNRALLAQLLAAKYSGRTMTTAACR